MMGSQKLSIAKDPESRKKFLKHLLHDVEAIDKMLKEGLFESGISRIGAEQEFCLVDSFFKPSKKGPEILEKIDDPHFTPELARYNLEINLDPLLFESGCFSAMEQALNKHLEHAERAAADYQNLIILTGILPSINYGAVQLEYMTPKQRYIALAEIISELRGEDFELNITGVDELMLSHSNILFEACNTSFQCHLQIEPDEFADMYNWAQMLSGPVLSVCANSPILLGRQLWAETRIPLFQQSVDTRGKGYHLREREQRVTFGNRWIRDVGDVFRNDIARHTLLFLTDIQKDSLEVLQAGEVPALEALQLHNGTIYKWNRPCYGVNEGTPHLRIENRYLPSGPTVQDEIANFAFWTGLMTSIPESVRGNWENISFEDSKENFYKAAMWGVQAGMVWDGELMSARRLLVEILLPMARKGLRKKKVDEHDIDKYLNIIEKRISSYNTGTRWIVKSFRNLKKTLSREEASVAVTAIMHNRRKSGKPVHSWSLADEREVSNMDIKYETVRDIMITDLITVQENDLVELVLKVMEWRNIRHLPVENHRGKLAGIVTKKRLVHYLEANTKNELATVADVMEPDPVTISPEKDIHYAILLMLDEGVSSLLVLDDGDLVGIITDKDTRSVWEKMKKKSDA